MALGLPLHLADLHDAGLSEANQLFDANSYKYQSAKHGEPEPEIPHPDLFAALPTADPGPKVVPTTSECAVHLEILEVFHSLRNKVTQSADLDATFGIHPTIRTVYNRRYNNKKPIAEPKYLKEIGFEERRKPKWTYYLELATVRFHHWIAAIDNSLAIMKIDPEDRTPPSLVPPLDVLVVWHAFLLNPDDFKDYCRKKKLECIQHIVFPWAEIHRAIDSKDWTYRVPLENESWLRSVPQLHPDLLEALSQVKTTNRFASDLLEHYSEMKVAVSPGRWKKDATPNQALAEHVNESVKDRSQNKPLVANVERQCVFVDKMHAHRWIRSPAAKGTLRRAVDRYQKFLNLFRLYPNTFLVPTLDVDLVWHTHQCSANHYREFVVERVGRFINHEDNISRGTLDNGFSTCEQWYRLRFGEQYQICLCWYCEAILSAVEERDDEDVLDTITPDVDALARQIGKRVLYYREVEMARRQGYRIPQWEE